jgi:plastocyanin
MAVASAVPMASATATGACVGAEIYDFEFEPADLSVSVGTTVTWENEGPTSHTVTADDGSFDSTPIVAGASFSHTFDTAGTFAYHCAIHPEMTGTVTVA